VRRNLIKEVADLYENKKIEGVSDLLEVMSEFELEK
jgi:predicted house-cleaning noncanonical NTP pyrophosphatase (MazG superfamily)